MTMTMMLFCYDNAHSSYVYFGLALKSSYNWNKVYVIFFILKGVMKDIEARIFFIEFIVDPKLFEIYPQVHLC
jgi:hypothetical protein